MKIDRERLNELLSKKCSGTSCQSCIGSKINSNIDCTVHVIVDILEQNPDLITGLPQNTEQIPLPVKTTWSLKPECCDFCKANGIKYDEITNPSPLLQQFYDCKTEPDYSGVPIGAVVEIVPVHRIYNNQVGYFKEIKDNYLYYKPSNNTTGGSEFDYPLNEIGSLTILKLPEGK